MKRSSAKDEFRTGLVGSLHTALAEITGQRSAIPDQLIEQAVNQVIDDWHVTRIDTPNSGEHPLAPQPHGHHLRVTLPHVPETDAERTERELRLEAFLWSADDGPPPERVGVNQFLRQDTWWRMTTPDVVVGKGVRPPTVPVLIEDMTHDHRVALLAWLRQRARRLHSDAFARLGNAPDDLWMSHERTDPREWLEGEKLVQALVRWTTPWAESPLTWRPMREAPRIHETVIVVRYPSPDGEQTAQVVPSLTYEWATFPDYEPLTVPDGHGGFDQADPIEWRELRDDELPTPVTDLRDLPCAECGQTGCLCGQY